MPPEQGLGPLPYRPGSRVTRFAVPAYGRTASTALTCADAGVARQNRFFECATEQALRPVAYRAPVR